jgi:AmmeMemoRadiSam system protein B
MIRKAFAAGRFYPGSASEIREMMAVLVDKKARKEAAIGLLMPHAGYPYSGPVAGATISRVKFRDTFIIMGPSHTGLGKPYSIMTEGSWQTPLGEVEIDSALGKKLLAVSDYLQEDEAAHLYEHAVEVQVPFLQYLKPDIRIVPIILAYAPTEIYKAIGRDIARAIKESDSKAVIIASGDMTHYEPQKIAEAKDKKAIEAMLKLDEDELTRRYEELNISMCAYGPAVCLISAAKELGATGAELVRYQTSGDTTGDYSSVVGYAGLIIKGGGG